MEKNISRYGPGCKIPQPCAMSPQVQNTPLDIGHRIPQSLHIIHSAQLEILVLAANFLGKANNIDNVKSWTV